ncbi:DUF1893 domain-containing protein [Chloroflexota bacterium]
MATNNQLFKEFLETEDTLWVCLGDRLHFKSVDRGVKPLFVYIQRFAPCPKDAIVFDRMVGNAAALLLEKVSCEKVYSLLGSELAVETLKRMGIDYSFSTVVPYISNQFGDGMCPFEKASIGKSPDEFYQFVEQTLGQERSLAESSK